MSQVESAISLDEGSSFSSIGARDIDGIDHDDNNGDNQDTGAEDDALLDDDTVDITETIEDTNTQANAILSPLHETLLQVLRKSSILKPLSVQIKNDSYWYYSRKQLHARNQIKLIARHNANNFRYEAYAFKMKPRDEDLEIVPQLHFISSHNSRLAAIKKSEAFCRERDANPGDNKAFASFLDGSKLMQTHFRIQVVSDVFYRLSNFQRVCLVMEQIHSALAVNSDHKPGAGLGLCPPTSLKLGSTYGENMCALQLLGVHLPSQPLHIVISAKTPSQWRPDKYSSTVTERFSRSGVGLSSITVPTYASAHGIKKRIKLLGQAVDPKPTSFLPPIEQRHGVSAAVNQNNHMDLVGVRTTGDATSHHHNKVGGVFGHFFADLSNDVRALVLERTKANKEMIQKEAFSLDGGRSILDTRRKSVGVRKVKPKIASGEYDKGTHSETEMLQDIAIHMKFVERLAIRMQRLRRRKVVIAAQKWLWRRQYATLTIQRWFRGCIVRRFVKEYAILFPVAVIRIQRCYRIFRSRNLINVWAWACLRISRVVIPKLKAFFLHCVRKWYRVRYRKVVAIQSMVRMFLARGQYFALLGARFNAVVSHTAAIQIQRVYRGRLGRRQHSGLLESALIARVDIPAANRIQRVYRGYQGKLRAIFQRKYLVAARMLQDCIRYFVHRKWYQQIRIERIRHESAIVIQRVYRGRLDREIAKRLAKNRHFIEVFIPAVIKAQTQIRGFIVRSKFQNRRDRFRAAICIQRHFRQYQKRLELLAKWRALMIQQRNQVAATIQKIVRGRLARMKFRRLVLERQGRVTYAAKIIMRAWVNFKYAKRMQFLLDANRVNIYTKKIERIATVRKELELDREEILADVEHAKSAIARSKQQIHRTEQFLMEIQLRLPRIKTELLALTQQDAESGWPEALRHEYESLSHQGKMGKEELRIRRAGLMKLNGEVERLHFELEECYIELDNLTAIELENFEALRRAEVGLIERKVNHKHNRLIRLEKCRWKVESTRLKIITRKQEEDLLPKRKEINVKDLAYSETISFEKRAVALDKEQLVFDKIKKKALKLPQEKTYSAYAQPVNQTYDSVLSGSLSLLRNFTLDERANRMKKGHKQKEMATKRRGLGQFAPLKSQAELEGIAASL